MDTEDKIIEATEGAKSEVEAEVKERKKPGPKPKVQQAAKVDESSESAVVDNVASEQTEAELPVESTEDIKPEVTVDVESKPEVTTSHEEKLDVSKDVVYTYTNRAIMYAGPSDKRPTCYVNYVRLTGEVKGDYAKCSSCVSGYGKVEGYVRITSDIHKLIIDIQI